MNPTTSRQQHNGSGITLSLVLRVMCAKWRQILRNTLLALLCALVVMFFLPQRYHSSSRVVVEEFSYVAPRLKAASLTLGIDIGNPQDVYDAYLPVSYPDFLQDNRLLGHLLFSKVTTIDHKTMTYGEYLRKNHTPLSAHDKDILRPSETLDSLLEIAKEQLKIRYNTKKCSILMDVSADDPYVCQQVCRIMGDYLLDFIRDYRVKKQSSEVEHFAKVERDYKRQLEDAQSALSAFSDSHWGSFLPSVEKQKSEMSDEVVSLRHLYENVRLEHRFSRARLQDVTPAFVVYDHPSIPSSLSGLNRAFFCFCFILLSFLYSVFFYMRHDIWAQISR